MGKTLGYAAAAGLLVLGAMQMIPVHLANPPVTGAIPAPAPVEALLRQACFDCHSNETQLPWYSRVAPASWLLASDVNGGREELNFSEWDKYSPEKAAKKLRKSLEELSEGDMPPWYYLPAHPQAKLSDADLTILKAWLTSASGEAPQQQ